MTHYMIYLILKIQRMIEIGDIEIAPLAFMRGVKKFFAILDEAQTLQIHNKNVFNKNW